MKQLLISSLLLCGGMALSACGEDNTLTMPENRLDQTDTYYNAGENYKSDLYYKPYVGYVGDPMPYYDSKEKSFKILYLQDMRDGNSVQYHPVYQLTTTDAASYQAEGEAIPCGNAEEEDPAIGTGSTVEKDGKYYTFYTGHKAASPKEVLLKAVSEDGKNWKKDKSFRLQAPVGYNQDEFRDPYVFYDEEAKLYRMVVSAIKDRKPILAQFTSTDLVAWKESTPFFHNKWGRFYECPDIFKMGDYWYLIYSDKDITRQVQYFYATTLQDLMNMGDDPQFPWRDEGKLEGASWYASKSASNGKDRYIWGWCATRQGNVNENKKDWAGTLVAHKITQNEDGTLGFTVPDAVAAHFDQQKEISNAPSTLSAGDHIRFGRLDYQNKIEFTVSTEPGTSVFGLSFVDCSDKKEQYRVYIEDRWNNLKFDKYTSAEENQEGERTNINAFSMAHAQNGKYHVTVITDQSVCVVYINGQYAFTNRIYGMQRNPWGLFCSDGKITLSDLKLYGTK